METTFQPSLPDFRSKMESIEAIELSIIGFLFTGLVLLYPSDTQLPLLSVILLLITDEGAIFGSWAIYLGYIRFTRGLHPIRDLRLRTSLAVITSTYTLWTWIIFDINRWILAKLVYQGEAPVEYAWSAKSKLVRKLWEEARKAGKI